MARWVVDGTQRIMVDEPVERLHVRLVTGRLNVVATDGPARIEVVQASRVPILIEYRTGHLIVRHERVPKWPGVFWWLAQLGRRFRVEISIAVPASAQAELHLVDGSVIVSGLRSSTAVTVTSGQVTLMGLGGQTRAKLVSGPVEALGVKGDVTLETISGELVVADSSAGRLRATTVSGAITCDLDNPRGSDIRLGTTSGSITVRVREDSDLCVRLRTASGRITSGFAEVGDAGGPSWAKERHGVIGSGTGQLSATTASGSIALLARPVVDDETDDEADNPAAEGEPR
jgi:hypothetical protein